MLIQIYHKERWVYLKSKDGGEYTTSKERAFPFSNKDAEKMKEELEAMGFQVIIN